MPTIAQAEALERVQAAEEALTWVGAHDMEGTYREMEAELRSRMKAGDTAIQIQMQTLLARWCAYPFDRHSRSPIPCAESGVKSAGSKSSTPPQRWPGM